jgi:hypothetical protein
VLRLSGLMSALLIAFEYETDEMGQTPHGHEKNPILAALYVLVFCFGWI